MDITRRGTAVSTKGAGAGRGITTKEQNPSADGGVDGLTIKARWHPLRPLLELCRVVQWITRVAALHAIWRGAEMAAATLADPAR